MITLKRSLLAAAGLTLLIGTTSLLVPATGYGQSGGGKTAQDVNVVNTPNVNVANTAAVNVANTPTVSSRQDGAWNVGIDPTSNSVQVANTTASPVPVVVVNRAPEPFQASAFITQTDTNLSTVTISTVPAGKRLVVEFVSAVGVVPAGHHVISWTISSIPPPSGGTTAMHYLLVNAQQVESVFVASQPLRLYADPGSEVRASFLRDVSPGMARFEITVSGYLVDVP